MPLIFILLGLLLVSVGVRNTQGQLVTLLEGDFTGQGNFIYWFLAVFIIGAAGYYAPLRTPSRAFLGLLIVVVILASKGGVFSKFTTQIAAGSTTPSTPASTTNTPNTAATGGVDSAAQQILTQQGQFFTGNDPLADPLAAPSFYPGIQP